MAVGPVTEVRVIVCRCIAGRSSPKCRHSNGGQPQGARLVPCTHTAIVAWVVYCYRSWAGSSILEGRGNREWLRGLVSANN